MITTTMTATEILHEYKIDYQEYLKQKLSSLATRKTHDLKVASGRWVKTQDLITKTPSGNKYSLKCKLRWDKKRGLGWSSVATLETLDSRTGKRVVYLLSDEFPILLSSSFLREIKTSLSEFLEYGATWDVQNIPSGDPRYTDYVDFGNSLGIGVGGWENGVLVLRHLLTSWEGENPISHFLESRQQIPEVSQETYKSEIDKAWEEYYNGSLG